MVVAGGFGSLETQSIRNKELTLYEKSRLKMPWFRVQVEQTEVWNIGVEAESREQAEEIALSEIDYVDSDYTYEPEVVLIEEAKHVE